MGIMAARAAARPEGLPTQRQHARVGSRHGLPRAISRPLRRLHCAGECNGQIGGFERTVRSNPQSEEYFFVYYEQSLIPGNDSYGTLPFFSRRSDSHALAAHGMTGAM
jgi:hypothetical protein